MQKRFHVAILGLIVSLIMMGCSSNKSLNPFQPEIINNADNFAFQATGVKRVSTTVQYTWSNSGDSAKVNQACAITGGSATVTLLDNNGTQVYTSSLAPNGDFFSSLGVPGSWTIRVVLSDLSGTLNFRAQKQ